LTIPYLKTSMQLNSDSQEFPWRFVILSTVCIAFFFSVLSFFYETNLPFLTERMNVWFGTDIPRFVGEWVNGNSARFHFHPLSFMVYSIYGAVLKITGFNPHDVPLAVMSLPVVVYVLFGISLFVGFISTRQQISYVWRLLLLLSVILISPALIFTPVPESHMSGGVSLLLEANFVLVALRELCSERNFAKAQKSITVAILFCIFACGFSISNVIPAMLVLMPLLSEFNVRQLRLLLIVVIVTSIFIVIVLLMPDSPIIKIINSEKNFMMIPTLKSLAMSFDALVIKQFGVPVIEVARSHDPVETMKILMPSNTFAPLSSFSFIMWSVSFWLWFRQKSTLKWEKHFFRACFAALFSMIIFYAIYANYEAYLFSAHSWPFIILPGIYALGKSVQTRCKTEICCFICAICLSAVQTFFGMISLFNAINKVI